MHGVTSYWLEQSLTFTARQSSLCTLHAVPYTFNFLPFVDLQVEMLMRVGGVAHTIVPINFTRKPAWFLAEVPDGTTPVVIYNGRTIQGSGTILAWVQDTFKSNYTTIPTAPTPQALAATNEVTCAMENWIDKRPDSDQWVSAQTEFTTAVCHLETALFSQDYFCGSALGVEDAMFFPQFESAIQ
jgi:glutathione S-transferase